MNHHTTNEATAPNRPPTTAHFHYTSRSTLTLPIVSLVAIIGACVAGYAWFASVDARVANTNERVSLNSRAIGALQAQASDQQARLIRIEESVKWIRDELVAMRKEGR